MNNKQHIESHLKEIDELINETGVTDINIKNKFGFLYSLILKRVNEIEYEEFRKGEEIGKMVNEAEYSVGLYKFNTMTYYSICFMLGYLTIIYFGVPNTSFELISYSIISGLILFVIIDIFELIKYRYKIWRKLVD
jgi:hypothetical protein